MSEINKIFNEINNTKSLSGERRNLLLNLVDNHKSTLIIPFLIDLIKKQELPLIDSTTIYACNEYSVEECVEDIELFIDIIIDSNFEAAWTATHLIHDMRDYFEKINIERIKIIHKKLSDGLARNNENIELIKDVIFYIEDDIIKPSKKTV